ncbi:putative Ubiquitin domain-containing protein [Helianthus debilis subsp. tardiflorus]
MFWPAVDANRVSSPRPWSRGNNNMFSNVELPLTRDSFWRMAPRRNGGRTEIWEALREAAESEDLGRKQRILDVNNIRLGNRDMTICYDDTGTYVHSSCIYVFI